MTIDETALKEELKRGNTPEMEPPKKSFLGGIKEKVKAKIKEKIEFNKEINAEKKTAFKKESIVQARRAGKAQAKSRGFSNMGSKLLGSRAQDSSYNRLNADAPEVRTKKRKTWDNYF